MTGQSDNKPLLSVDGLVVSFGGQGAGRTTAVDHAAWSVFPRQTLAIVGESGCGKSVTALSVLRLLPPSATIDAGAIRFRPDGVERDLTKATEREMRAVRGDDIAMIFQEPMTSLNPVYSVGDQITEAIRQHRDVDRKKARAMAIEAMDEVGIPEPATRLSAYPHQFSGGMRQRVMIAMALACQPKLLIADEPTTALDVTIQAQILELLHKLRTERDLAIVFITHDLGVVAENADAVCVMYAGRVVEFAPTRTIFESPQHPYTRGLLACIPTLDRRAARLRTITDLVGDTPVPLDEDDDGGGGEAGLIPWWPRHDPPDGVVERDGTNQVLARVGSGPHWVSLWGTKRARSLAQDAPMLEPSMGSYSTPTP